MSADTPAKDQDKFVLRLPDGMRERIKAAADENKRSMNAEIVARLENSAKHEDHQKEIENWRGVSQELARHMLRENIFRDAYGDYIYRATRDILGGKQIDARQLILNLTEISIKTGEKTDEELYQLLLKISIDMRSEQSAVLQNAEKVASLRDDTQAQKRRRKPTS